MFFRIGLVGWLLILMCEANLKVEITQGQVEPTPIALTDLISEGMGSFDPKEIVGVIENDLVSSGLFRSIDKKAFIQDSMTLMKAGPRFADWRLVNAQLLFSGRLTYVGEKIRIEFRLFDVFSGTQLLGLSVEGKADKWRELAHMIADAIYKRATGEAGYFNTKIAFVDESGPKGKKRIRRLAVMDFDGYNPQYLTDGTYLAVTPRFSPTTMEVAYLSYKAQTPTVHIRNLTTGADRVLGSFEGMTFAPRFSPDGNSLIMSLEQEGSSAIFVMNLRNGTKQRLTPYHSIDTSPCYSPDGRSIVFVSDRENDGDHSKVNLFVMDANGGNIRRISSGEGRYFQPVWSPRGDWIAFTKQHEGTFYVGVMKPDGSEERTIVTDYLVESPCWSANGRELLVTIEKGSRERSRVYRVDITGYNLRPLNTPREASDGAWSRSLGEIS